MSGAPRAGQESPLLSAARHSDAICARFEDAWKKGQQPQIEDYLVDVVEPDRSELLRKLLALELEYRRLGHETLVREHYQQRFPGSSGLVRSVFSEILGDIPEEAA